MKSTQYLVLLLLLTGFLSLPLKAQDPTPPTKPGIAGITTFSVCAVTIDISETSRFSIKIVNDGHVSCRHFDQIDTHLPNPDDDTQKIVMIQVSTKLTDEEMGEVKQTFAQMDLGTLESPEIDQKNPTRISIQAINQEIFSFEANLNPTPDFSRHHMRSPSKLNSEIATLKRVEPFLKVITKIADRLKREIAP